MDLAIDSWVLFWSGIVPGTLSIGILGYAVVRNWWRWKEWRQRQAKHSSMYLTLSHFLALRGSPWITVGERERTHALHGNILYPTISSAAPDASARASVGAPQVPRRHA